MGKQTGETPRVPRHVAIIMDGNGRWAQQRGLPRIRGHEEGSESVRAVVRACRETGVEYLTLYAFSVENWVRPKAEVTGLMRLLDRFLRDREAELHENNLRFRVIGRRADLPEGLSRRIAAVEASTRAHTRGQLILAVSYGGRTEIAYAARAIARGVRDGTIDPETVDEQTVAAHLYAPDVPDPDLLIRTSGEMRLSNFLLWQLSYAELHVTEVLWPDFREKDFKAALADYARRHRRLGNVK